MQVTLHQLELGVPHVFTVVTRGISQETALGSLMRLSSGAEAQDNGEEDGQDVEHVL